MTRHNFNTEPLEQIGRKRRRGAIACRTHDFEFTAHLEIANKIIKVSFAHAMHKFIATARSGLTFSVQNNLAQFAHLIRAVRQRSLKPHLHTGPTVGIMACRDHRDRWRVQMKLREIGHRGQGRADVFHMNASLHQAQHQRVFH